MKIRFPYAVSISAGALAFALGSAGCNFNSITCGVLTEAQEPIEKSGLDSFAQLAKISFDKPKSVKQVQELCGVKETAHVPPGMITGLPAFLRGGAQYLRTLDSIYADWERYSTGKNTNAKVSDHMLMVETTLIHSYPVPKDRAVRKEELIRNAAKNHGPLFALHAEFSKLAKDTDEFCDYADTVAKGKKISAENLRDMTDRRSELFKSVNILKGKLTTPELAKVQKHACSMPNIIVRSDEETYDPENDPWVDVESDTGRPDDTAAKAKAAPDSGAGKSAPKGQ